MNIIERYRHHLYTRVAGATRYTAIRAVTHERRPAEFGMLDRYHVWQMTGFILPNEVAMWEVQGLICCDPEVNPYADAEYVRVRYYTLTALRKRSRFLYVADVYSSLEEIADIWRHYPAWRSMW